MPPADEILVSAGPGETRLALMAEGRPLEFLIDRGQLAAGDIVLGRVVTINRALNAGFVDIGEDQLGFLPNPAKCSEGDAVLVQVTASARGGKGAGLTAAPSLPGRLLAYTPFRSGLNLSRRIEGEEPRARLQGVLKGRLAAAEGIVVRTEAVDAAEDALVAELDALRRRWRAIEAAAAGAQPSARLHVPGGLARMLAPHPAIRRVRVDDLAGLAAVRAAFPAAEFDAGVFDRLAGEDFDLALERRVPLAGGGALTIEATAAATVIDIDSGGGAPLAANLAAIPEIARQLRLRNVAGHILIDIIPLKQAQGRVVQALRQAVAEDPTPTHVVGTTPLGLVEMTRERRHPSLAEMMLAEGAPRLSAEAQAFAALRVVVRAAADKPGMVPVLAAAPAVAAALARHGAAVDEASRRLGRRLAVRSDAAIETYHLIEDTP